MSEDVQFVDLKDGEAVAGCFVGDPGMKDGKFLINFYVQPAELKILETDGETFRQVLAFHESTGLGDSTFELRRQGDKIAVAAQAKLSDDEKKAVAALTPHKLDQKRKPKVEYVDPETRSRMTPRLKATGKALDFLAHFKVSKMSDLKKSDIPEAEVLIAKYEEEAKAAEDLFA